MKSVLSEAINRQRKRLVNKGLLNEKERHKRKERKQKVAQTPEIVHESSALVGSKMRMWKQDPSTDIIGVSTVFIPSVVNDGPSDDQIVVVPAAEMGMKLVKKDENGDFDVSPEKNMQDFEMVHCFCVVRMVLNMYERFIRQFKENYKFKWAWSEPSYIKVIPRAGEEANAYYSREDKAIMLYYYKDPDDPKKLFFTCHSFDIIAHECGHAILDGLRPEWIESEDNETLSMHESFADLTVIFALLSQMDVVEVLLSDTKANLHNDNFLSNVAEQFGKSLMDEESLRNCINTFRKGEVSDEPHELSQVMTGCVYDIISDILLDFLQPLLFDTSDSLLRVSKMVRQMVMYALYRAPKEKVTFKEIGEKYIEFAEKDNWNPKWKAIVQQNLKKRNIL